MTPRGPGAPALLARVERVLREEFERKRRETETDLLTDGADIDDIQRCLDERRQVFDATLGQVLETLRAELADRA